MKKEKYKYMTAKKMAENAKGFVKNYAFINEDFEKFCEQLCIEQRDICALNIHKAMDDKGFIMFPLREIRESKMPEIFNI